MKLRALFLIYLCFGIFANGLSAEMDMCSPDFWKTATVESVKELIQHEARTRENDKEPEHIIEDVFFRAMQMCPDPQIIAALVKLGADIEGPDHVHLRIAAAHNNPQVIKTLVNLGANINAKSQFAGRTPLMFAAENQDPEVVETLIQLGAEVDAKDKDGETALSLAASLNPTFRYTWYRI